MSVLSKVTIRPESVEDFETIHSVVAAAFGQEVEAELVTRIRQSAGYMPALSLVAVAASKVVGHVMISAALLKHNTGERPIVMLSPLAVDPGSQRLGIGAMLVAAVTSLANEIGETFVVLEGSPVYYGRLGFEPASKYGMQLPLPSWAPIEAAQLMPLDGFNPTDTTLRGVVVYPSPFDGLN